MNLDDVFSKLEKKELPTKRKSPRSKKLSVNYEEGKPLHFDAKVAMINEQEEVISCNTYINAHGEIYTESILRKKQENTYALRVRDVNYDVIEETLFNSLEEASKQSSLKEILEDENDSLVRAFKQLLSKIEQVNSEQVYLFKLLVDPNAREQYEINSTNTVIDRISNSINEILEEKKQSDNSTYLNAVANRLVETIRSYNV